MRSLRRAAVTAAGVLAVWAAPAGAAIQVGQSGPPAECADGIGQVQTAVAAPTSYIVPSKGVITSFTAATHLAPAETKLLILEPVAGFTYRVAAKSNAATFTGVGLQTFPTRVPVQAGQLIGNYGRICLLSTVGPDTFSFFTGPEPATGADQPFPTGNPGRIDLSAALEPDADNDLFGDETQDLCPTNATTQGPCPPPAPDTRPPETTITKGPPNKTEKPAARFEFSSDEASSTFDCKLKGKGLKPAVKQFAPCSSAKKYKKLDPGKYKFFVVAKDAANNIDATPATDRFKVVG